MTRGPCRDCVHPAAAPARGAKSTAPAKRHAVTAEKRTRPKAPLQRPPRRKVAPTAETNLGFTRWIRREPHSAQHQLHTFRGRAAGRARRSCRCSCPRARRRRKARGPVRQLDEGEPDRADRRCARPTRRASTGAGFTFAAHVPGRPRASRSPSTDQPRPTAGGSARRGPAWSRTSEAAFAGPART